MPCISFSGKSVWGRAGSAEKCEHDCLDSKNYSKEHGHKWTHPEMNQGSPAQPTKSFTMLSEHNNQLHHLPVYHP